VDSWRAVGVRASASYGLSSGYRHPAPELEATPLQRCLAVAQATGKAAMVASAPPSGPS
jgi:hypothetical protein